MIQNQRLRNDCGRSSISSIVKSLCLVGIVVVLIVLAMGCCPEFKNGGGEVIPRGNPMYVARVTFVLATVINVDIYRCNGSLIPGNWTNLGPVMFIWNAISQRLTVPFDICWDCIKEKTIPYYQCTVTGTLCTANSWKRYDSDVLSYWDMIPLPPSCKHYNITIYLGTIMGELPVPGSAGDIWLLWVCGSRSLQGIPPKVIGVTPV